MKTALLFRAFVIKDARLYFSYRLAFLLNLFSILFGVATYFFLGETLSGRLGPYGRNYFPYVLLGMTASTFLLSATGSLANQLAQELRGGTLEIIMAAPCPPLLSLMLMSVWPFLFSVLVALLYLGMGSLLFGVSLQPSGLVAALSVLALSFIAFYSLGLLATAFILWFKRGNPIQWLLASVQVLLGGVYFPVDRLPASLAQVAHLLPLVHTVEGLRAALLLGKGVGELQTNILLLAAFAAVLLPLSLGALHLVLRGIRCHSTFLQH